MASAVSLLPSTSRSLQRKDPQYTFNTRNFHFITKPPIDRWSASVCVCVWSHAHLHTATECGLKSALVLRTLKKKWVELLCDLFLFFFFLWYNLLSVPLDILSTVIYLSNISIFLISFSYCSQRETLICTSGNFIFTLFQWEESAVKAQNGKRMGNTDRWETQSVTIKIRPASGLCCLCWLRACECYRVWMSSVKQLIKCLQTGLSQNTKWKGSEYSSVENLD